MFIEKIDEQEKKNNEQIELHIQTYNDKLNEQEEKYKKQIELQTQIYNDRLKKQEEKNNEQIKSQAKMYNNKISELQSQIEDLIKIQNRQKQIETTKQNNDSKVINLGKFFNNRRKNNNIFSIHEPISYEDLERLATEIILLNEDDANYFNNLAK